MSGSNAKSGERAAPQPFTVARHWAIPVALLAGHLGAYGLEERGPALVGAPLFLFAALRLWQGNGRRRILAVDQFILVGPSPRRDRVLFMVSVILSAILLLAVAGRAMETYQLAGTERASNAAIAQGSEDVLDAATEEQEAINTVLVVYAEALRAIIAESEDPMTDARQAVLRERVAFIKQEKARVCRLRNEGDACAEAVVVYDEAERAAILSELQANAERIAGWD